MSKHRSFSSIQHSIQQPFYRLWSGVYPAAKPGWAALCYCTSASAIGLNTSRLIKMLSGVLGQLLPQACNIQKNFQHWHEGDKSKQGWQKAASKVLITHLCVHTLNMHAGTGTVRAVSRHLWIPAQDTEFLLHLLGWAVHLDRNLPGLAAEISARVGHRAVRVSSSSTGIPASCCHTVTLPPSFPWLPSPPQEPSACTQAHIKLWHCCCLSPLPSSTHSSSVKLSTNPSAANLTGAQEAWRPSASLAQIFL